MRNKRFINSSRHILLTALAAIGVALFVFFQVSDRDNLKHTVDECISFAKLRITNMEKFNTNDQVKSLVRLLDKSIELGHDMTDWEVIDGQQLDSYAEAQRLSGVLVLDEKLETVLKTTADADSETMWSELIHTAYVGDIVTHTQKTYTTRITIDGNIYDFAAVAREDAPGLIITYVQKDQVNGAHGDLTIDSLFTSFPFEMNGMVVVCDDKQVVSSNNPKLLNKSKKECEALYSGEFNPDTDRIVRLKSDSGTWYGKKAATGAYTIYMFFPASQVYMKRNIVCGVYILIAITIYLLHVLGRSNNEKAALAKEQKRLRIINAIGQAYTSISLVDLKAQEVEVIKSAYQTDAAHKRYVLKPELQKEHVNKLIAEPFRQAYLEYINMDTVVQRLDGRKLLSFNYQTIEGKWMLSLIIPQRYNENGVLDAVLIANRDVTADKLHEIQQDEELRQALAEAKQANTAKTAFLNNMSHDIRTPMNAIVGFSSLAASHIDDQESVIKYLNNITIAGDHLLSLINDVLDMSRIENGSVKIEETKVYLPEVVRELDTIVQGNIEAKHQKLIIESHNVTHEDVLTDKLRLSQVLLNILNNAVKYTPEGGRINVDVTELPSEKADYASYEFRIKDNGIGVDKEFQEHIFDSFARERTATESGIQGTGLGLAIAKNIVDLMHGTITLNSEKGKGSEFAVRLDFKIAEAKASGEPHLQEARDKQGMTGHRRHAGLKVLLAEDNELNREIAVALLEDAGIKAYTVNDGTEAVERMTNAAEGQYDLILMDVQMPRMDGYTATAKIRALSDASKANIPIIAMTANAFEEDKRKALEAGMNGHIAKPININAILDAIDAVL